jgi:cell division protein FtsB
LKIKLNFRSTQGRSKKSNNLFGFFYRYWISIILIIVLNSLINQNFVKNNFPTDVHIKQNTLNQSIAKNKQLSAENQQLKFELTAKLDKKLEIVESMARQKFGLIKSGEKYYQINIAD